MHVEHDNVFNQRIQITW